MSQQAPQSSLFVPVIVAGGAPGDLSHPNQYTTLRGLQDGLRRAGCWATLIAEHDLDASRPALERLVGSCADRAVVAMGNLRESSLPRIAAVSDRVVWVDAPVWEPTGCVRRDERTAGAMIAAEAIRLGYRRLLCTSMVRQAPVHHTRDDRVAGVRDAALPADVPVETFEINDREVDASVIAAILATLDPTTAVIAGDYYRLEWIYGVSIAAGLLPGRAFGLLCIDEAGPFYHAQRAFTRASFDRYTMGCIAAEHTLSPTPRPSDLLVPTLLPGLALGADAMPVPA